VELAKSCDYAIRGLLFLAQRDNPFEPVLLRDIARRTQAPEAFLSKVFQALRASNLVQSHRGRRRGYSLARPAAEISLYDVIVATEGPATVRSIAPESLGQRAEDPFRRVWEQLEREVMKSLKRTTLRTILDQGTEGRA
jgi:Rrf2 family protein